jgi:hypothetical protein
MRPTRVLCALALLAAAACTTNPETAGMGASAPLIIDQPVAPFPYNSRWE